MEEKKKKKSYRSLRKWSRLLLAIVASVLLLNKPVFNFVDEKGLENTRTCVMTPTRFELHYIEMATGIDRPMYAMSVKGLYYGAWAILLGCVFCAFFYEIHELRIFSCLITAFIAGAYYLIMIYYAIRLSQKFCIILYPNLIAMLPVAVLLIMLSIRNTTVRKLMNAMQAADEAPAHEK
jgi:hypothetical protein